MGRQSTFDPRRMPLVEREPAARRCTSSVTVRMLVCAAAILIVPASARGQTTLVHNDEVQVNLFGVVSTFLVYNNPKGAQEPTHNGFDPDAKTFNFTTGWLPTNVGIAATYRFNTLTVEGNFELGLDPVGHPTLGSFGRVDLRQVYVMASGKFGSVLLGRSWTLFNLQGLLYDLSLFGVGRLDEFTAAASRLVGVQNGPAFGHGGLGELWNSHRAQLRYTTPAAGGFQLAAAVMEPEDVTADLAAGFASFAERRTYPRVEAQLTYAHTRSAVQLQGYASGTIERVDNPSRAGTPGASVQPYGLSAGLKVAAKGASIASSAYIGKALGQRILFFEGVDANGERRTAKGIFTQAAYAFPQAVTLGVAYGLSRNDPAPATLSTAQVEGKGWTLHLRKAFNRHLTLVTEYTRSTAVFNDGFTLNTDTAALGGVLAF
jgi:hypothetical protein